MWLFAMFDLPVTTAKAKGDIPNSGRSSSAGLLDATVLGLRSVLRSEETATTHRGRIRVGAFRRRGRPALAVTDRQFGKMESYIGE